jgi:putative protein-disulfide isomerase
MKMFYFTDAMCSWCYGFSPAMKKLKENYPDIDLQIIAGGFAPGSKQAVTDEYRNFLEYHWRNVHLRSGQPFDHSMKFVSETFQYDTEPSSRALTVMQQLLPGQDFEFLSLMQRSFYVEGKDITSGVVLAELAEKMGVEQNAFSEAFNREEMKRKTLMGFQFSRQLGVEGFPTLLTLENGIVKVITRGYQSYDSLRVMVDAWLNNTRTAEVSNKQSCTGDSCEC